ncbi:unnamed protein product [Durusdinium trenchii]|uniref:RING-type domain-containing protein n=1 Tax=Durusdinium trenchii TaxID=1381693 RepID=A0ABP0IYG6_9DINO
MTEPSGTRQASQPSLFTRSASAIISGGGVVTASTDDDGRERGRSGASLLERQRSRRQVNSSQVQDRLRREAIQNIMNSPAVILFTLASLAICAGSVAMFFFFVRAVYATLFYHNEPCDQPLLKMYVICSLAMGTFTSRLSQWVVRNLQSQQRSTRTVWLCSTLVAMVPGWIVLYWGYSLIQKCHTCQTTNPILFSHLKSYIYFQIVAAMTYLVVCVPALSFAHRFLLLMQQINMGEGMKGCADKIKDLPKVANNAPELRDPDDGSLMECCICLTSFASQKVVRTPCGHYFHEHCLSHWCQAHVSCPLCKSLVADPENPGEMSATNSSSS